MSANPFDWLNAINDTKRNLVAEGETGYNPFMVNRGLSYFPDTVMHAAEMTRLPHVDGDMQFTYLLHAVRKRRRFSKWSKQKTSEDLQAVMDFYHYNSRRAQEALRLLSPKQIKAIREKMDKGG